MQKLSEGNCSGNRSRYNEYRGTQINLKQMVRDEQVDKMVQECVVLVKNTPEDTLTVYEIFKCLHHRQERNNSV
ncbi:hypothetical protein MTP99_004937 [Tenebrio molitor]|nr:hypothetical protein MTP99_004937 [Tenebrio molitor]